MNNQLQCREFRVRQVIGEERKQVALRSNIAIPPGKPAVEQVIKCWAEAEVIEVEQIRNKVILRGEAEVHVTYVGIAPPGAPAQPVHHVEGTITFTQAFDIKGLDPDEGEVDVFVQLDVESCKTNVRMMTSAHGDATGHKQPRDHVTVTLIIQAFVKVTRTEDLNLLISAPNAKVETISLEQVVASGERQVVVSEVVDVADFTNGAKPCPEEVLDVISDVEVTETEIINDRKVIVEGILTFQVIYVAVTPGPAGFQPVHHVEIEVPFTQFVELDEEIDPDDFVETVVRIEDAEVHRKGDCDIQIDAVLQVKAEVTRSIDVKVVTEVSPVPAGVERTRIRSDRVLGVESSQVVVRDVAEIPAFKPEAQKALECEVIENRVSRTEILPGADKVLVRGVTVVKLIYVANIGTQPVHAFETEIPWTTFVEFDVDIEDDDNIMVDVDVEFTDCNLGATPREVVADLVIKATVKATRIEQPFLFVCTGEEAEAVCPPGKVPMHYTIRAGDTCFGIANRFGMTVNELVALNPGLDCDNLQVGRIITVCGMGKG